MPSWNNDLSANKFKNMYIQDINSTGFALDVSGDVILEIQILALILIIQLIH